MCVYCAPVTSSTYVQNDFGTFVEIVEISRDITGSPGSYLLCWLHNDISTFTSTFSPPIAFLVDCRMRHARVRIVLHNTRMKFRPTPLTRAPILIVGLCRRHTSLSESTCSETKIHLGIHAKVAIKVWKPFVLGSNVSVVGSCHCGNLLPRCRMSESLTLGSG